MKLSRAIGQTSQILLLYVQDASVSTGAGLANVIGSSVSFSWFHNNQVTVTSGTASTAGTTGTYSTSAWTQVNSSKALGWYSFGAPDGIFSTGDSVGIQFYGAPNMVPLPVEIELTRTNNQQFASSTVFLANTSTSPANVVQAQGQNVVTSASGQFQVSTQSLVGIVVSTQSLVGIVVSTQSLAGIVVSTQTLDKTGYIVNVSSWANSTVVATSSGIVNVNVVNIWNKSAVTSASGILTVSTQTLSGGGGDILTVYGQPIVTTGAGIIQVSTQAIPAFVTSSDSRLVNLDISVSSRLAATAYTAPDNAGIANISTQVINPMDESYRPLNSTGTMAQLMYEVLANVTDFANTGTSRALNSVTSHSVGTLQYQYDSTTPSSITRIA